MKHIIAIAIKFVSLLALLYVLLGVFFGFSFTSVLLITSVLVLAEYVVGDLMILPRTNNFTATLLDFGMIFVITWLMTQALTYNESTFGPSLIVAFGAAVYEWLFHAYLQKYVLDDPEVRQTGQPGLQYQTEASEELLPLRPNTKSREHSEEE